MLVSAQSNKLDEARRIARKIHDLVDNEESVPYKLAADVLVRKPQPQKGQN
jgi:hypothetical protein